jgi:L-serine dehydratase
MGGTPEQVLMAAEIAMEHHLDLPDPLGFSTHPQRNTMGAIKPLMPPN